MGPLEEDETLYLPIINEKDCRILNEKEFSSISFNKDLICLFDKEKFVRAFSEITRSRPLTLKLTSDENIDMEYIIFKGKEYTFVVDKFKKGRLSLDYTTPDKISYQVDFIVHPIRRKVSVIDNRTLKEEFVDILDLVEHDKNFVGPDKVLDRVGKAMQDEWEKLHKVRKNDYIH
jgi:hypothetical protein